MIIDQLFTPKKLYEFAPSDDDDSNGSDPEELLRRMAAYWWNGTERQMAKVENTLAAMGWEIGQDDGYDDGGVFVVRAGDEHGGSYISWPHEDLELNESGLRKFSHKKNRFRGLDKLRNPLGEEDAIDPSRRGFLKKAAGAAATGAAMSAAGPEIVTLVKGFAEQAGGMNGIQALKAMLKVATADELYNMYDYQADSGILEDAITDSDMRALQRVKGFRDYEDWSDFEEYCEDNNDVNPVEEFERLTGRPLKVSLVNDIVGKVDDTWSLENFFDEYPDALKLINPFENGSISRPTMQQLANINTAAKGASLPAPVVAMANAVAGLVRQIFKANGQPLSEPQQVAQGSRAAPALPAPTRPEFDMTPDLRQKEKVPVQRKGDDEEQGVTEGLMGSHFVRRGDPKAYLEKMRKIHKTLVKGGYKPGGYASSRALSEPYQSAHYVHSTNPDTHPDVSVDRVGNQGHIHVSMKKSKPVNLPEQDMAEGHKESYIIVRTDREGKKDVFAGNFDTYEQAQKELDGLLDHPLHTKHKQKFEIKRKGQKDITEMDKSEPSAGRDGNRQSPRDDRQSLGRDTGPRSGPDRYAKPITSKQMQDRALDKLTRAAKDSHKKKDVKEADSLMMKLKRAMIKEGRVKELADDLKTLADADFMKKYGKAKAAIRASMKRVDEATPAMPAAPAAPAAPAEPDPAAWRKAPGPGYQTNAIRDRSRVNGVWRNNPQAANPMSQDPAQRMAGYQEMEKRIAADNAAARAGVDNSDPEAYEFDHWLDNGMGYATPVLKSGAVQGLFKKPLSQVPPGAKILPQYDTYQQQGEYAYPVVMGGVDQAFKVRIDQVPKGAKIVQAPQQGGALFKNLPGAAPATPPAAVAKPATPATPAPVTELSTNQLARYKTAAAKDAKRADQAGDFKRGDKRLSGMVQATKKQFDNDAKKVDESRAARRALMARIVNNR